MQAYFEPVPKKNKIQAKAVTFGSALMLAQRTFGDLGFSFVRLNLIHKIMPKVHLNIQRGMSLNEMLRYINHSCHGS